MKYQCTEDRIREVMDSLGGYWVLIDIENGLSIYSNVLNDNLLYIFDSKTIKGYGTKRYGMTL